MIHHDLSDNPATPAGPALGTRSPSVTDGWDKLVMDASGYVPSALTGPHLSIRSKILLSHLIVIILLVGVNAVLLLRVEQYNRQFDQIITNILTANSINGYIKPAIDLEMWNIVAGKTEFTAGSQYRIIGEVNGKVGDMIEAADSDKSRIKLEVIMRAMDSLTRYVDIMGAQIAQGSTVADNEEVLENVARRVRCCGGQHPGIYAVRGQSRRAELYSGTAALQPMGRDLHGADADSCCLLHRRGVVDFA